MKRKSLVILILAAFFLQMVISQPNLNVSSLQLDVVKAQTLGPINNDYIVNTPGPEGMELIKTNVFYDGGMEEEKPNHEPAAFYGSGTGNGYTNHSYKDEVHSGSYGAILTCKATPQYGSSYYSTRYVADLPQRSYLYQDISYNVWFNAKANPDYVFGAEMYLRMRVSTNLGNRYLNYYLSRVSGIPLNSSTTAYFDERVSLNTWSNVERNLTKDIEQAFPGVNLATSYVTYIYFYTTSVANPSGSTILLFDDIVLTNGTGFNYLSQNGDFEDGNSYKWYDSSSGGASLTLSKTDYVEGTSSMNLTSTTQGLTSSPSSNIRAENYIYDAWGEVPKGWFGNEPGEVVYSFDWKYSDSPGIGSQYSYFYIYSSNNTYTSYLYFILGDENNNLASFSNYSYSTYSSYAVKANGFGIRDTWQHFTFDLYELYNTFKIPDVVPNYVGFYTDLYNTPDVNVQLLVDEFKITTYPAGDASFENNIVESLTDPLNLWVNSANDQYINITSDAFDGDYAANLTSYIGATNINCYKNTFFQITSNVYTDFYWRLDEITNIGSLAYSEIRLELDSSYFIHYILGNNSFFSYTNSSSHYYYFVEGHDEIGTWNNLFRDVSNDITIAFGEDDYNITQIYLSSYATGTEVVSTIFDHIHFSRDIEGPQITNSLLNPVAPEYDEPVDISVEVHDNIAVAEVELSVQIDGGSWLLPMPMTLDAGRYTATIPGHDYGTTISYYFAAIDINGHITLLGSQLNPYDSYVVTDTVNPVLVYEAPPETQVLNGTITFNFTDAYDLGSGIQAFEIQLNGSVIFGDTAPPESYQWNTEMNENGEYLIVFKLFDTAGNIEEIELTYTVYNPPTWWESFIAFATSPLGIFTWSASGALTLGIFILVVIVRARRKKKIVAA
ncbi:MAG: hypothetical protein FK734_08980 [Asgard group archaeon]|nr:hypothetical protein [Asgard group archaeon]